MSDRMALLREVLGVKLRLERPWIEGPLTSTYFANSDDHGQVVVHGAAPGASALALVRDVFDALTYAHEQGSSHLAITPEQVWVGSEVGSLAGMGVVQALRHAAISDLDDLSERIAPSGYVPAEPSTAPGPLLDYYQLGALAYELVTGSAPPRRHRRPAADVGR